MISEIERERSLVNDWLRYSEDKRTSGGLYFVDGGAATYVIGTVGGGQVSFSDAVEACANYIVREMRGE